MGQIKESRPTKTNAQSRMPGYGYKLYKSPHSAESARPTIVRRSPQYNSENNLFSVPLLKCPTPSGKMGQFITSMGDRS